MQEPDNTGHPRTSAAVQVELPESLVACNTISAKAIFVGEHLNLRQYARRYWLGRDPLMIPVDPGGVAVLFRYGVAVLFNSSPETEQTLLTELAPVVTRRHPDPETEELSLRICPQLDEGFREGAICLRELNVQRLQLVALVLSKSVVLAEYESRISENFDRVEPFAVELSEHGRGGRRMKNMLRQIGSALLAEHRMVGRVEVREKPELLWEHTELEPLYQRLEDEFEIGDRYLLLERKLSLLSRISSTVLDLLQNRRTLRVEWYIVILIVLEILLTLYELFWHVSP